MKFKISEAAGITGGFVTGNPDLEIDGLAKIEEAGPGDLTFLYLPSYEKFYPTTKATAILVKPGFNKTREDLTYIEVTDPNKAFSKLIIHYFTPDFPLEGIDNSAIIDESAEVGEGTAIGKNVVISKGCRVGKNCKIFHNVVISDNVEIGDDCLIHQNVSIREECKVGSRVILQPGAVIGSDGFGFYTDEKGRYIKIPQVGNVILEDDVEVGANAAIDRAALGSTILKRGVKLDNLVQIAHNVVVGEDTVISSQSGVSGSTKIGKHCILAGQVGLVGHIEIHDNIIIMAQSGVSKTITKPGQYFGYPAKELKTTLRQEAHIRNLEDYAKRITELEKELGAIKKELGK
jgi:UDP-3-O-[3-hydroxymyristoyl] glucosamine N-acyltransferase